MKAVVLDTTGKEATVMTHEGDIIAVRNRKYDIGQEIIIKNTGARHAAVIYRLVPAVTAVAAAAVMVLAGARAYFNPYGTVSLDVNPSIEYTINRFDRVLEVSSLNDDGSDVLLQIDTESLRNKNIEDALEATIEQIEADGYMTDDDTNYVVVSAHTRGEDHTDRLLEKIDGRVKGHGNIKPMSFKVSDDELNEAHDQGISAGKKKMVDRLEEVSGEKIDRSKWNHKSVRDIEREYDRIKEAPVEDELPTVTEHINEPEAEPERKIEENGPVPGQEQPAQEQPMPEKPAPENIQEENDIRQGEVTENDDRDSNPPDRPMPEQNTPKQPAPEQPAPEQPAPEQPAPEQPAPEQPAPEQPDIRPGETPPEPSGPEGPQGPDGPREPDGPQEPEDPREH